MDVGGTQAMAGGGVAARWRARPLTDTERNWLYSALILAGSLALFGSLYGLEMNQGRWHPHLRLVYMPSETVMRFFGVSHVLIATLYLLTSRKMRSWRSSGLLLVALTLGIGVCMGYAGLRGLSPRIASAAFFLYFIIHDFRDQVFFYFQHGDAPAGADRQVARILFWVPLCGVLGALALAVVVTLAGVPGTAESLTVLQSLPAGLAWGAGALVFLGLAGSLFHVGRLWRQAGEGPALRHLLTHRPIYMVMAGSILLVLLGWTLTGRSHVIVILHVTAWYVFILRQLLRRRAEAPAPRRFSWQWLRGTPAGFNLLHLGTLAVLLGAGIVWVYGFRSDPELVPLWATLDVDNFRYWTLLHVTLSFRSR